MVLSPLQTYPAGGGVTDHGLLAGLGDDDHAQYALLAGRSGGQDLAGGDATAETLTLRANAIDADGVLILKGTSPHAKVTGGFQATAPSSIGAYAPTTLSLLLARAFTVGGALSEALRFQFDDARDMAGTGFLTGIKGFARAFGSAGSYTYVDGCNLQARQLGSVPIADLRAGYFNPVISAAGLVSNFTGMEVYGETSYAPTTARGVWVRRTATLAGTAVGVDIDDIIGPTAPYLLRAGPATSNLRLDAGAPAANVSQLLLAVNNGAVVLRRVEIGPVGSGGAGYRYLRVLN